MPLLSGSSPKVGSPASIASTRQPAPLGLSRSIALARLSMPGLLASARFLSCIQKKSCVTTSLARAARSFFSTAAPRFLAKRRKARIVVRTGEFHGHRAVWFDRRRGWRWRRLKADRRLRQVLRQGAGCGECAKRNRSQDRGGNNKRAAHQAISTFQHQVPRSILPQTHEAANDPTAARPRWRTPAPAASRSRPISRSGLRRR